MTVKHTALKEVARGILKDMGFKENEIEEEYVVVGGKNYNSNENMLAPKKYVRVDVVGINKERSVAIECGICSAEKISLLKFFFTDVILLPFFSFTIDDKSVLRSQRKEIESLTQRLENIEKAYEKEKSYNDAVRNYDNSIHNLMRDINELIFSYGCDSLNLNAKTCLINSMISTLQKMLTNIQYVCNNVVYNEPDVMGQNSSSKFYQKCLCIE
jgi:hypothetical protein